MGPIQIYALMASAVWSMFAAIVKLSSAASHKFLVCSSLSFAFQLDDLDSGLSNELWFLVIVVVVVLGIVYVYRGPRKT